MFVHEYIDPNNGIRKLRIDADEIQQNRYDSVEDDGILMWKEGGETKVTLDGKPIKGSPSTPTRGIKVFDHTLFPDTRGYVDLTNYIVDAHEISELRRRISVDEQVIRRSQQRVIDLDNNKQNKLTAGRGILIENDVISLDYSKIFTFKTGVATRVNIGSGYKYEIRLAPEGEVLYFGSWPYSGKLRHRAMTTTNYNDFGNKPKICGKELNETFVTSDITDYVEYKAGRYIHISTDPGYPSQITRETRDYWGEYRYQQPVEIKCLSDPSAPIKNYKQLFNVDKDTVWVTPMDYAFGTTQIVRGNENAYKSGYKVVKSKAIEHQEDSPSIIQTNTSEIDDILGANSLFLNADYHTCEEEILDYSNSMIIGNHTDSQAHHREYKTTYSNALIIGENSLNFGTGSINPIHVYEGETYDFRQGNNVKGSAFVGTNCTGLGNNMFCGNLADYQKISGNFFKCTLDGDREFPPEYSSNGFTWAHGGYIHGSTSYSIDTDKDGNSSIIFINNDGMGHPVKIAQVFSNGEIYIKGQVFENYFT